MLGYALLRTGATERRDGPAPWTGATNQRHGPAPRTGDGVSLGCLLPGPAPGKCHLEATLDASLGPPPRKRLPEAIFNTDFTWMGRLWAAWPEEDIGTPHILR